MQSPSEQSPTEFREVAHTGGKFTLTVVADEKGALGYSPGCSHNRPTAAATIVDCWLCVLCALC